VGWGPGVAIRRVRQHTSCPDHRAPRPYPPSTRCLRAKRRPLDPHRLLFSKRCSAVCAIEVVGAWDGRCPRAALWLAGTKANPGLLPHRALVGTRSPRALPKSGLVGTRRLRALWLPAGCAKACTVISPRPCSPPWAPLTCPLFEAPSLRRACRRVAHPAAHSSLSSLVLATLPLCGRQLLICSPVPQ